jgi:predicted 3-demethylubiquinone-9 3-methyltransferase (glyoxalase superfamily)
MPWPDIFLKKINQRRLVGCVTPRSSLGQTLALKHWLEALAKAIWEEIMNIEQKIIPHLWFDTQAEEAVNFYVSLFAKSKVGKIARYGDAGPGPKGSVMSVGFTLNEQEFAAINGGPHFKFNGAVSFLIWCDTQAEIDELHGKLLQGGEAQPCGWLTDRFGLVWQVNYKRLPDLMTGPKANNVMGAMMKMKKIDIQGLKDAAA